MSNPIWVHWCYSQPAELCFGHRRYHILASTGVQQGDPLGTLLFSLVLLEFLDSTSVCNRCCGIWMMVHIFLACCPALLNLGHALACTSTYPNVNCLQLAFWRSFIPNFSNTIILQTVAWSCWGLLFGDLISFLNLICQLSLRKVLLFRISLPNLKIVTFA